MVVDGVEVGDLQHPDQHSLLNKMIDRSSESLVSFLDYESELYLFLEDCKIPQTLGFGAS